MQDQALGSFFSHYVLRNSDRPRGHFEYLPSVYCQAHADEHLNARFTAVGLADLVNIVKSPELMNQARLKFGFALQFDKLCFALPGRGEKGQHVISGYAPCHA
jgi:hypothetical protein